MTPLFAAGTTLLLSPALLVAARGLAPAPIAIPLAATTVVPLYLWLRRRERALSDDPPLHWSIVLIWGLLVLAATVQFARVGMFIVNPRNPAYAALPNAERWALYHVCFTGYTEAARLAAEGGSNIYDPESYKEPGEQYARVAQLPVDEYEYPPPFLPLPAALSALTRQDFHRTRALFFGLQAVVLVVVMVASVFRLPPSSRRLAWALIPGVLVAFQTMVGMQYGNFQSGAFALAVGGMLAATRNNAVLGTAALAFAAVSKLFPGLLLLVLLGARRYKAVATTIAWMASLVLLSLVLFGTRPYTDFVVYQLPAISSGSGFAWAQSAMLIPTNYGISGAVLKVGALGVPGVTFDRAMQVASVYGAIVTALALFLGWRLWRGRASDVAMAGGPMLWLALLNLASFRSPYVADAQATMGTLWALSLVMATARPRGWRLALATFAWICWSLTFEGIAPRQHSVPLLAFTLAAQIGAYAFNVALVLWVTSAAGFGIAGRRIPAANPRSDH